MLSDVVSSLPDDDAAEGSTSHVTGSRLANDSDDRDKTSGQRGKKWTKEERKNKRGANKGRRFQKMRDDLELCWRIASGRLCEFGMKYVGTPWIAHQRRSD